jgi:hypothetical protein
VREGYKKQSIKLISEKLLGDTKKKKRKEKRKE